MAFSSVRRENRLTREVARTISMDFAIFNYLSWVCMDPKITAKMYIWILSSYIHKLYAKVQHEKENDVCWVHYQTLSSNPTFHEEVCSEIQNRNGARLPLVPLLVGSVSRRSLWLERLNRRWMRPRRRTLSSLSEEGMERLRSSSMERSESESESPPAQGRVKKWGIDINVRQCTENILRGCTEGGLTFIKKWAQRWREFVIETRVLNSSPQGGSACFPASPHLI